MDFTRASDFYAAPFPSDDLMQADGHIDLTRTFPNPQGVSIIGSTLGLIARDARGFAQTGGIFFKMSSDLDASHLPSLQNSVLNTSRVFLMAVDTAAPDYLQRYPVEVRFESNGGIYGSSRLLSLLPLQGIPLRPGEMYAAVVLRSMLDSSGHTLGRSQAMVMLADGRQPPGMNAQAFSHYKAAIRALEEAHVAAGDIAGLAVFSTDTSTKALDAVVNDMLSRPLPVPAPFKAGEIFDNFCVYNSTLAMPDYQEGAPPFASTGGDWTFDLSGQPILQRRDPSLLVVTIPRQVAPARGFPTVVFIRTGGGGNRPLVDRGVQAMTGGPPLVPGSGPAQEFARVGLAGVEVDGPLEGLRNPNNANEDFLIFNVANPPALRDNIRESAAELALLAHVLPQISIDVSSCPGAAAADGTSVVKFDTSHLALMGHSMGASIAPLVVEAEPSYRALILSGAGSSYIENVMDKQQPFPLKPVAEQLLGYDPGTLKEDDPVLSVFQWGMEPSDSQIYARTIVHEPRSGESPRQVLMLQGIVDNYIRPRIANGISLALGLDLAGAELDVNNPAYTAEDTPLGSVLWASHRSQIPLPASGNINAQVTAVVVQHPGDGIEDGHEVVFQTEPPKNQYRCFLADFAADRTPRVPPKDATGCE